MRHDRRSSTTTSRPNAIEGSLDVIADACAEVGVRVVVRLRRHRPPRSPTAPGAGWPRTSASCAPAGAGMVGVHAAFTCTRRDARGGGRPGRRPRRRRAHPRRRGRRRRRRRRAARTRWPRDDWLLVHCVHLDRDLPGTIAHNPAVEHEQRGRLRPARGRVRTRSCSAPTASAPTCSRSSASPTSRLRERRRARPRPTRRGRGSRTGYALRPRGARRPVDVELRPRRLAVARRLHPGRAGRSTCRGRRRGRAATTAGRRGSTLDEVRAKAAEQAARLFARL